MWRTKALQCRVYVKYKIHDIQYKIKRTYVALHEINESTDYSIQRENYNLYFVDSANIITQLINYSAEWSPRHMERN